jgi:hypothetical protein
MHVRWALLYKENITGKKQSIEFKGSFERQFII